MPHDIHILTEADLRACVRLDPTVVDVIENGFRALAGGGVVMPPVLSMAIKDHNGEVDVKTAYVPGFDGFALKVSPGFFDNPRKGLASLNGLMILLSATTGLVQAVFLDNGYLTDIRTAAAGAVAARHLAPKVETAGVIGTGVQARLQIQAAHLERPFKRCLVWGRSPHKAAACAADIAKATGAKVEVAPDVATLVAQSQLVATTTPATTPLITKDMLHKGLHITAMGSDQSEKNEIDPEALRAATLYVCDRVSQCDALGELRTARAAGYFTDTPPELGQIITGAAKGRLHGDDITICDLTGTGVQDTAIATHVATLMGDAGTVISA